MKLQLRAIGDSTDIDQLTAMLSAAGLRLARVSRGYPGSHDGTERAYLDIEQPTPATADGSAA
ncbi:MAG: hypothetical protein HOV68_17735 [Streptomycetaceae bacterium]|nr:hypothetical protein [Streptomycetaceae bacterium]